MNRVLKLSWTGVARFASSGDASVAGGRVTNPRRKEEGKTGRPEVGGKRIAASGVPDPRVRALYLPERRCAQNLCGTGNRAVREVQRHGGEAHVSASFVGPVPPASALHDEFGIADALSGRWNRPYVTSYRYSV
jgi:hypothetical protein